MRKGGLCITNNDDAMMHILLMIKKTNLYSIICFKTLILISIMISVPTLILSISDKNKIKAV